jgi:hypothetical protein
MSDRRENWSRREFLGRLTGAAGLAGLHPAPVAAEPPVETTKLRLLKATRLCWAPQYVAEELLRTEGFTDVICVDFPGGPVSEFLALGKADLSLHFVGPMKELPWGKWRAYDPEDTIRYCALRLHEADMIRSSPKKLLAEGTDWRFIDELKKELKG